jgi:ornithine carbamoyltransferase
MSRSVHHVFEAQAATAPHSVAVVGGIEEVTYAALDARANRYAHHLRAAGVGPESVVGVLLSRGPDLVAWLLAVWKAGAAYVPLDPDLPSERLGYMLETAGARLVVSESALADRLSAAFQGPFVWIDRDAARIGEWPPAPVPRRDDQHNLAYIIFTSGSTGRPKGVQISHRALLNLLFSMRRLLDSGSGDVWLASTSMSFDISGLELYLPLVTGGRVAVAGDAEVGDSAELVRLVDRYGATHVQATPSGWKLLLEAGFEERPVVALVGGEALPAALANAVRSKVKRLVNVYGPTETTIWSTTWDVPGEIDAAPIGRPIANTRAYVLDRNLQPVAVGVVGELYLAGDGVARGYVNRPELTAETFLPEPFGRVRGARMYRTGDLVRFQSDGNLEFLGRADHQVKIRGHRIELAEIEERLLAHPDLRDGVVVARVDEAGEKWLAAYVVSANGRRPEPAELRDFLGLALPPYMVPAAFVALDALPLNSAGKVDRRALPTPGRDALSGTREFVAPRNDTERLIADICSQVLGISRVGAHDRFLDLGADSMRIVQLVSAARQAGLPVKLRMLYQHGSVAELAQAVGGGPVPAAPASPAPAPTAVRPANETNAKTRWLAAEPTAMFPVVSPRRAKSAPSGPSPVAAMAEHRVPGASIALIRDGELVSTHGYGVLAAGGSDPVTPDTPFQVASISKHVTALAVLRLVRDGLLDLDVDINRYLVSWRVPNPMRPVTVRHLLANLSGLSMTPNTGYQPTEAAPTLLDVLYGRRPATSDPIRAEATPGATFRKTNSHYAVLQQVLVDLIERPFPQLMHELVFEPLGMNGSSFAPSFPARPDVRAALGHDEQGIEIPGGWRVRPALAAGGLWSTAADLARVLLEVHRAHRDAGPKLLTPALATELLTVAHPGSFYGLGTVVDDTTDDVEFGHPGETVGYRAMMIGRVRSGTGFVVLTNAESGKAVQTAVADEMVRRDEQSGRGGFGNGWESTTPPAIAIQPGATQPTASGPAGSGAVRPAVRHLVSINDLSDEDLRSIVARGAAFSAGTARGVRPLDGDVVGIYFRKTSTRTRTAFSSGALRLGGQILSFGPSDLQTNTGETLEDTGRVLSRMLDVLVARTAASPEELRTLAAQDRMSVVNAMSADEHPTQALTDLTTLQRHFGRIDGLRILYVGEGNNTAVALALALARYDGGHLEVRTPPGYGLGPARHATAGTARGTFTIAERHDMADLPGDFDVIYTTRWQTTGTTKPDPNWREIFAPFQVNAELWRKSPRAVFMHDLPAHRGEEVTADVLDGPASIAFDQAENKMHSAMAVLEWCRLGPVDSTEVTAS